ncbi:DegV family protein, partial [Priestia sp. SIMBA_032]|uniref:DegV family protein n=1 Tax=Priestia sp. SIMBA_032 TaxID=3085775 RepID=UPI00397A1C71
MKIAIVTDSTAYIPKQIRDELNIYMIPLNVVFGAESYQEEAEIAADDLYVKGREQEEVPKTS